MKDCFEILNISPSGSFVEIKKAYRDQLLKYHPDRAYINNMTFAEANSRTQKINEAYNYIIKNFDVCKSDFERAASDCSVTSEQRTKVKSSNLDWVEYYPKLKILIVSFKKSGIYLYENVPDSIYMGLINASSKGRFLYNYIAHSFKYHLLKSYDDWYNFAKRSYANS